MLGGGSSWGEGDRLFQRQGRAFLEQQTERSLELAMGIAQSQDGASQPIARLLLGIAG